MYRYYIGSIYIYYICSSILVRSGPPMHLRKPSIQTRRAYQVRNRNSERGEDSIHEREVLSDISRVCGGKEREREENMGKKCDRGGALNRAADDLTFPSSSSSSSC